MHPAQIKALLTIAGHTQKQAADACGVSPPSISSVINGRSRSKQVEEWIAEATGRTLLELWPQWYGEAALVLADDERDLVRAYRELSAADRQRLLSTAQQGLPPADSRGSIQSTGSHARIAAGDYHENAAPPRRKK